MAKDMVESPYLGYPLRDPVWYCWYCWMDGIHNDHAEFCAHDPLVNIQKAIEHDHRNSGFSHEKL